LGPYRQGVVRTHGAWICETVRGGGGRKGGFTSNGAGEIGRKDPGHNLRGKKTGGDQEQDRSNVCPEAKRKREREGRKKRE